MRIWNEAGEFVDVNEKHKRFGLYRKKYPLDSKDEGGKKDEGGRLKDEDKSEKVPPGKTRKK